MSDYVREFGEQLAKAAERVLVEINRAQRDGDNEIHSDLWSALGSAIHEFRKRAAHQATVEIDVTRVVVLSTLEATRNALLAVKNSVIEMDTDQFTKWVDRDITLVSSDP